MGGQERTVYPSYGAKITLILLAVGIGSFLNIFSYTQRHASSPYKILYLKDIRSGISSTSHRTSRIPNTVKININNASLEEIRLLGVTKKAAIDLIKYRENIKRKFPHQRPFKGPEDLEKAKVLSSKEILRIIPFIEFN